MGPADHRREVPARQPPLAGRRREDLGSRPEYQLIRALDLLAAIDAVRDVAPRIRDPNLARALARARSGRGAPGLPAFVAEGLAGCALAQPQDDLPAALEHVIGIMSTRDEDSWARGLLGRAQELIAPLRGGDGSSAQDDLVLTAVLVLAAILAITGSAPQGKGDDPNVVLLRGVLTTLIALTVPEHQNQTVLLVRV